VVAYLAYLVRKFAKKNTARPKMDKNRPISNTNGFQRKGARPRKVAKVRRQKFSREGAQRGRAATKEEGGSRREKLGRIFLHEGNEGHEGKVNRRWTRMDADGFPTLTANLR